MARKRDNQVNWGKASKVNKPKHSDLPLPPRQGGQVRTPLEAIESGMAGAGVDTPAGEGGGSAQPVGPGQTERNEVESREGEESDQRGGGGGIDIDALADAIVRRAMEDDSLVDQLALKLAERLMVN